MPAINPNPTAHTIRETLALLDRKELSTVQMMAALLTRMQETDEQVQAWLDVRPKFLMELAETQDRRRSIDKPTTPLFGIPVAVKDIIDLAGYQTVCNMKARESVEPAIRDAEIVHRLRKTGVIYVGKTVTQEAAAGIYSDPCCNPWDTTRIPGGSSGGSAAAVANGTALGAFGTDTGGSIRIPASLCGVTGLKPTYGRLSVAGIFPLSASLDTPGSLARAVADCMALYLGMQGKGNDIPTMWNRFPTEEGSLAGVRIGVITNYFSDHLSPDVEAAWKRAVAHAERIGAEIVDLTWDDADAARIAATQIQRAEAFQVHRDLLRTAPHLMGEQLRSRVELGAVLPADVWFTALNARERAKASIAALYAEHRLDAVLVPSTPITAPKIGETTITYSDGVTEDTGVALTRLTQPWNATGQPVFALPAGLDRDGLPIGLSLVGRPDDEWHLADIAHALETCLQ
ncbi:MAG: amidase [Thermomicrobiales bacterium]|nr:amidase [Thermomicrobiales bacterium]MCO5217389.1 amidase [Thermomicrobiales bacterium]MCO5224650.1 amidase [Thermomicrobiales bacterium]MCO5226693.1 amidase [Thermomicrobiales bacterium]